MKIKVRTQPLIWILVLIACMAAPGSSLVSATIGETVVLSGGGGGYDTMYLFLTGPNLAPAGVRLDSVSSTVIAGDPASFTRTVVEDGRWEYAWDTSTAGGSLDAGAYLVWATPVPLGRYDLSASGNSYATIGVTLTTPVLTAGIATIPSGSLKVTSEPSGAEVSVNSVQYGSTPLVIDGLAGGPAGVSIEKDGYRPYEGEVVIRTGTMAVLDVTLNPMRIMGATVLPTGSPAESPPSPSPEPTPASAPWSGPVAVMMLSLAVVITLTKKKEK